MISVGRALGLKVPLNVNLLMWQFQLSLGLDAEDSDDPLYGACLF